MKLFRNLLLKSSLYIVTISTLIIGINAPVLAAPRNNNSNAEPKNIIVMISDGWGYNHILSTNYYEGVNKQIYENFPVKAAMSTYEDEGSIDYSNIIGYDPEVIWSDFNYPKYPNATDSASAATAMASGEKTYNGAIGWSIEGEPLFLISELAEGLGKATGVVTSVEFSHATPAGFVAHNISRNNYADIANEMIYSSATDVIMGTGAPDYNNDGESASLPAAENGYKYVGGSTTWTDITDDMSVTGADADGDGVADNWTVIRDRADFQALAEGDAADRVLGIPYVNTTLQQSRSGDAYADPFVVPFTPTVPTLAEMSIAALNVLDNDADGFFLMIEGGAVDWASHGAQSGRMIEEQVDFNNAVEAVVAYLKANNLWDDTLLIVTGDHECGYLWGPGSNPTWEPIVNNGPGVLPGIQWNPVDPEAFPLVYEHTNQLIPIFVAGQGHQLIKAYIDQNDPVRGSYMDNTEIAKLMFQIWDN